MIKSYKILFFLFLIGITKELIGEIGPPHALGINTELLFKDVKDKVGYLLVIPPLREKLLNIRVEADLLVYANNQILGIFVGDSEENLLKPHFGWKNGKGAKGVYLFWDNWNHVQYRLNIIGEEVKNEEGKTIGYQKELVKSEGRYPLQFYKYAIEIEGTTLTAWFNDKLIYKGDYINRPEKLRVALFYRLVGDYPILIDNFKIFDIKEGKKFLVYENDFEDEEQDFSNWKTSKDMQEILIIREVPMGLVAGIGESIAQLLGKGWYGFGIPGWPIVWLNNNIIISAPGEGEIQVTDISNLYKPEVLSHIGVGFLGGFTKFDETRFLIGPRGDDFIVNFEDPKKPLKEKISWQWGSQGPPKGESIDFRSFIVGQKKDWIASINPYSKTVLCFWDISEDILKPKFLSSLQIPDVGMWGGLIIPERDIILLSGGRKGELGWGIAVVDIEDINNPVLIGWLPQENTSLCYVFDKDHILVKSRVKNTNNWQLEIWEIEGRNPDLWKKISVYKPEEYPLITGVSWDKENRELIVSCAYQEGTQDSVFEKSEGGKREGSSAVIGIKVSKKWEMAKIYQVSSWGISRFKTNAISPDGKYLAVSDYNYGVWILKRDIEKNWVKVSGFMTPAEGHFACWDKNRPYVYVFPTFGSQMRIFDVTDPTQPKEISQLWLEVWTEYHPTTISNFVIVPQRGKISIIDVTDVKNPKVVNEWRLLGGRSAKVFSLSEKGLVFIAWTKSDTWGKWKVIVQMKKIVGKEFIDLGEIIVRDEDIPGGSFPPSLFVEGNRLYVNDISADILSVWIFTEEGKFSKIGEISTKDLGLNKDFHMPYPGAFAVYNQKVYLPILAGKRKLNDPVVYVIDTSQTPFIKVFTYSAPMPSYLMSAKIYKNYLLLSDYYGQVHVFRLIKGGKEIFAWSQFSLGELSWELGDINPDGLLASPGLWNLGIFKLK